MSADNRRSEEARALALRARAASRAVAIASTDVKNAALDRLATLLDQQTAPVLAANELDLQAAREADDAATGVERLA